MTQPNQTTALKQTMINTLKSEYQKTKDTWTVATKTSSGMVPVWRRNAKPRPKNPVMHRTHTRKEPLETQETSQDRQSKSRFSRCAKQQPVVSSIFCGAAQRPIIGGAPPRTLSNSIVHFLRVAWKTVGGFLFGLARLTHRVPKRNG